MVSYSYKDHEYRLTPMILLTVCWDGRAKKLTPFFWALFCIAGFALVHWYMSNPGTNAGGQIILGQQMHVVDLEAQNPKFRNVEQDLKGRFPEEPGAGGAAEEARLIVPDEPRLKLPEEPGARAGEEPRVKVAEDPGVKFPEEPAVGVAEKVKITTVPVPVLDPEIEEFKKIIQENAIDGMPQNHPIFVRGVHKQPGHERHLPKDHNEHRPYPAEFPVDIINSPDFDECGPDGYLVVIIIENSPDNTGSRLAIRSTWGVQDEVKYKNIPPNTWKTLFVMGRLRGKNADYYNSAVKAESLKYGDILQGDFDDNTHESTRKFMMALKWLNENHGVGCSTKFVLKSRDDVFINMNSMTEWLQKRWGPDDTKLYVGRVLKDDMPIRNPDDPLYVSFEDYSKSFFPSIIEGPVILFDWIAFERLFVSMKFIKAIAMEDAYIGLLADKAHILPKHNEHFNLILPPANICARLKIFFMNKLLPRDHLEIFTTIKNAKIKNLCPNAKIKYHDGPQKEDIEL